MEYDRSEIRVGLVLLAGLVLLVVFFAIINRWTVGEHQEAKALFANVMGLNEDASVQYAGRRAGWVKELGYEQVESPAGDGVITRVAAVLAVAADVPLTDADVAYIDRSLTGEVVVEIEPGPGTVFTPGAVIALKSKEVPTLASLMEESESTLAELATFVETQRPVMEETLVSVRDAFGRMSDLLASEEGELHQALTEIRQAAAEARAILEENREALGQVLTNAADLVAETREVVTELRPDLSASVSSFKDTMARVSALVDESQPRLEATLEDTRQTAATLRAAVEDLGWEAHQIAANVRVTVEDLHRNPWKVIFRPLGEDTHTQALFDAARQLVLSSSELARTAEQLERVRATELSPANQARVADLIENVEKSLERSAALQEELWETLKSAPR